MTNVQRHQQIHRAFAAINIGSVFAGLALGAAEIDLNIILLAVLFLMIRAKFWFDDEAYLEDVGNGDLPGGLPFGFGMLLALISWILFSFAGFFIKSMQLCAVLMIFVFVASTFWIVAAMVKRGAYKEQIPWLFFNCLYALGFWLIYGGMQEWNPFREQYVSFVTSVLLFLYVLFLADLGVTRIIEQKRRTKD